MLAAAVVGVFAAPAATQPPKGDDPKPAAVVPKDNVKMDEATKKAVDKALGSWPTEQENDGSWGNTAITGFALLAFMANGHMPNQGDYGQAVAKGVRYLCSHRPRGRLPRRRPRRQHVLPRHGRARPHPGVRHDRRRGREEGHSRRPST